MTPAPATASPRPVPTSRRRLVSGQHDPPNRLFKRGLSMSASGPHPGASPQCGGAPRYRAAGRFAGALQPRSELNSPPDGNAEVLCGAVLDNKSPISGGFPLARAPLTDSNRRPPPYHALRTATGRNRWQRFWLDSAGFGAVSFATGCHWLRHHATFALRAGVAPRGARSRESRNARTHLLSGKCAQRSSAAP
jgi:hypothetical protein